MNQRTVKKPLTLKNITTGNVWDLEENDVFRMLEAAAKDAEMKDSLPHYTDILRNAFMMEEIKSEGQIAIAERKKYERLEYKVGHLKGDETKRLLAIKKRPIKRVTDLTYENIRHISVEKLLEVLDSNFGGGWDSLSQSIRDIIESGFDISTMSLPHDRIKKKGGMYEKKIADGFLALQIPKGTWVEVIFAKVKPIEERPRLTYGDKKSDSEDDSEEMTTEADNFNAPDEDDITELDEPTDDQLNEETYGTVIDLSAEEEEQADEEYTEE